MGIQVIVHLVIFAVRDSKLKLLLTRPRRQAARGRMAIPGTTLHGDETFQRAAKRGLRTHAGADHVHLEQLYCSITPKEKGGGRSFSVAYYALLPPDSAHSASPAVWRSVKNLPPLSSTHRRIAEQAVKLLRQKFEHNIAAFQLLGKKFTLPELQEVFEAILGKKLDKRNFRKKIDSLGILRPLAEWRHTGYKPARLYTVAANRLDKLERKEKAAPA
jgi:8-oxo-dGTP diphosphatase